MISPTFGPPNSTGSLRISLTLNQRHRSHRFSVHVIWAKSLYQIQGLMDENK